MKDLIKLLGSVILAGAWCYGMAVMLILMAP